MGKSRDIIIVVRWRGHFLDWIMHFVYSASISVGFAANLVFNGSSFVFIFLGILYAVLSILDKAYNLLLGLSLLGQLCDINIKKDHLKFQKIITRK